VNRVNIAIRLVAAYVSHTGDTRPPKSKVFELFDLAELVLNHEATRKTSDSRLARCGTAAGPSKPAPAAQKEALP
jgi:hypothetical protein